MTVQAQECSLEVGSMRLLSEVSVDISAGSVVSMIGANGAGKTSLLRVLCGEQQPSSGTVSINGSPLSELDLAGRAQKIAVLPQRSGLDFPFLVKEVIAMGRYPHLTGNLINEQISQEVIQRMDLRQYESRKYTTLSGGERQRVQIARILAQLWDRLEGSVFFFDEPTAPLDLAHQLQFFDTVRFLADRGAAVLLVIHDLNLASRFSDNLILLNEGRLVAAGAPDKVLTPEYISEAFNVVVSVYNFEGTVQVRY